MTQHIHTSTTNVSPHLHQHTQHAAHSTWPEQRTRVTANTQPFTQPCTRDLQPRNRQGPGPRPTRKRAQEACPAVARGSSARGQTRKLPRPRRPGAASARASGTPRLAQGGGHTGGLADAKRREGARAQAVPGRRAAWMGRRATRQWEHAPGDAGTTRRGSPE